MNKSFTGWIALHRKLTDSAIYSDSTAVHLWIHLLFKANHKDKKFLHAGQMIDLKRGQILTGRKVLASEIGANESKIFRLLKVFESEQMIEQQKSNKFSIISILNYEQYQSGEQQTEQQVNSKRTSGEQLVNTNNNENNSNNVNNKDMEEQSSPGDAVDNKKIELKKDNVPYKKIVELYHTILPELPKVEKITATRQGQIRQRWKSGDLPDLDTWEKYFTYVRGSKFLMGLADAAPGRKPFISNLQWLTKEGNFVKVWEANYHG